MDEIKRLWDIYRYGKCVPCSSEIIMSRKSLNPEDFLPEYNSELAYQGMPRPGNVFYCEQIDPPPSFIREAFLDKIAFEEKPENIFKKARQFKPKKRSAKTTFRKALQMI